MSDDISFFDPSKMSQDDIHQMLSAGEFSGKQALIAQQMKQAQALRDTAMPEGRRAGGMYIAANPLETAAAAVKQGLGAHMAGALNAQSTGLLTDQTNARQTYFDILRKRALGGGGQPPGMGGGDMTGVPQGGDM